MAAHRLQDGGAAHAAHGPGDKEKLREEVAARKAEAEKVRYRVAQKERMSVADIFSGECRGRPRRQRHAVGLIQCGM